MIEKLLNELENMLVDAARVPFTNKRVIEEDELARFIDDFRENLPREMVEAKRIVNDRQRILDDAQREAQGIVEQAKSYVLKLTDDHIITKQAQEQAGEIIKQASREAQKLQADAVTYAEQVFGHLENHVDKTLAVVREAQHDLQQSKRSSNEEHEHE